MSAWPRRWVSRGELLKMFPAPAPKHFCVHAWKVGVARKAHDFDGMEVESWCRRCGQVKTTIIPITEWLNGRGR